MAWKEKRSPLGRAHVRFSSMTPEMAPECGGIRKGGQFTGVTEVLYLFHVFKFYFLNNELSEQRGCNSAPCYTKQRPLTLTNVGSAILKAWSVFLP